MSNEAFHYDEANSDETYAFIDVFGGATVVINRGDDGVSVEIFPAQVSDSPVAETWATWAEVSSGEQEANA
jgi:hypothetical protein